MSEGFEMEYGETEQAETAPTENVVDIHDIELLKKLWFMIRDCETSKEVFALIKLVIDSLPYDWVDPTENWLLLAQQLDMHGEEELASLFKLANSKVFQLSLKNK